MLWLTLVSSRRAGRAVAMGLAWFAFLWAVARSCVQAVTGDEAQDYLFFAAHNDASHWTPAANNHMLNSLGERMFTTIFGLTPLSIRIPTLLGAALYIYVAYRICLVISREWKIRIPVLICLIYNPFIADFFVAARGYGIANAFLLSAIAVSAAWHLRREAFEAGGGRELIAATAISSGCVGMAFTGNFSLAFTGATTMLLLLFWAVQAKSAPVWKLMLAGLLPGLAVVLFIPSWTILHFAHGEIVAGTKSLQEMLLSLVDASRYRPNPQLINPLLWPVFDILYKAILPVTGALTLVQLFWILRDRVWRRSRNDGPQRSAHTAWLCAFGSLVASITLLAIGEHRLAYRLTRWILMPVSRTALFLLPLTTLSVGIAAAIPALSKGAKWGRNALIGSLCVLSVYYFFCMRLTYFQEWDYQQDLNEAYKVVACYNHEKNVQDVESSWEYHAGMNLERLLSGHETFGPFSGTTPHTTGHEMYILEKNFERDFIVQQGLKIVFEGANTGMAVAVRADLADEKGGGCYAWGLP